MGEQLEGDISSIWNVFTGNTDEATARITAKAEADAHLKGRTLPPIPAAPQADWEFVGGVVNAPNEVVADAATDVYTHFNPPLEFTEQSDESEPLSALDKAGVDAYNKIIDSLPDNIKTQMKKTDEAWEKGDYGRFAGEFAGLTLANIDAFTGKNLYGASVELRDNLAGLLMAADPQKDPQRVLKVVESLASIVGDVAGACELPGFAEDAQRVRDAIRVFKIGGELNEAVKNKDWTKAALKAGQLFNVLDDLFGPCFTAGTPLLTPNGDKPIEQFKKGDEVLSRDEHSVDSPVVVSVVEEVFVRSARILNVHVAGQVIHTTAEHPFWVYNTGWTAAGKLQAGDLLSSHDGQWVAVEEVYDTGESETVYNLRVAEHHTYFVGGEDWGFSVWRHNACTVEQYVAQNETKLARPAVPRRAVDVNLQANRPVPPAAEIYVNGNPNILKGPGGGYGGTPGAGNGWQTKALQNDLKAAQESALRTFASDRPRLM